ncbi:hypothetical protein H5410_061843 [Solanum commersonii]|uniref:Uncharacterized protein n=1 Tax=Solanum commersonii TaxID=4109 RepID=A0A9J5W911_SOLCO|nr:hypothetical protein H5410_061843 [Solanum commersonii]
MVLLVLAYTRLVETYFFGACADLEKKSIHIFDSMITCMEDYKPLIFLLYFEFYARGEKIPFDQKEQILTSVDTLGIKTGKKLLVLDLNGIMDEVIRVKDTNRTVVVASFQDISSPLADRTCDSQEDACKDASPTGTVACMPLPWMSTTILSRYIFPNLNGIMADVIRVNDKSPIGVISSFLDHYICASLADADRTDIAASSQDTSSPLDDHTCNFQVDACKDTSPMSVGVVLSSPYRGICASP